MNAPPLNVVTGAFGFTGRHITQRLLEMGERVKTLTGHPDRPDPFGGQVRAEPFNFDQPAELVKTLEGASTLYNTYWVRFSYGQVTFDQAVQNTRTLFKAAREASVRRVVHVSITNPSQGSPLPYFRGKAVLERALMDSGLSYAILRPAVLFGRGGILFNNIAWFLRKFPVFAIPGSGDYQVQPIYVEDLADIAVRAGHQEHDMVVDAIGPETFAFVDLVRLIARATGSRAWIVHVPPGVALVLVKVLGLFVRDVVLTQEEIDGLMADLLVSGNPPTGTTRFSQWLEQQANTFGCAYAPEVGPHYR